MQARQKAELSATDAEDKLMAYVSSRSGEGRRGSKGDQQDQAKAMADLDASLMQRLDEDSATNHKLMESLKATQVGVWLSCMSAVLRLCIRSGHKIACKLTCCRRGRCQIR